MSWARPLVACANDAVIINVHAASSDAAYAGVGHESEHVLPAV
jgi:hypothetical protein